MPRHDVAAIKQGMQGRGAEILVALAGLPRESLDGRHHPCPKCGGTDRFRFEPVKEFVVCNKCFHTRNGDVIAALQWANGWDFRTTLDSLSSYLGIKSSEPPGDVLEIVARQKGVRPDSLTAY